MVGQIHRSVDGRFVLSDSSVLTIGDGSKFNATTTTTLPDDDTTGAATTTLSAAAERRNSVGSQNSSSDDGGFLSRRHTINARASWRRPLIASSNSHLSLQSATNSNRGIGGNGFMQGLGGLLRVGTGSGNNSGYVGARYQNVCRNSYGQNNIYRNVPPQIGARPLHQNLNATTSQLHRPITPNLYTMTRGSHIFSGSPASMQGGGGYPATPWTTNNHAHHHNFNELNSTYPGSSHERFLPHGSANRYRYYSHELPSLRTIQEETRRMSQQQNGFVPLHIPSPPSWRGYYHTQTPYHSYRPRTRWYPRHHSRLLARSQSELMSPLPHLNLSTRASGIGGISGIEASPESRSSSSGFGSKNTSNQQHGSHHSGSTSEWRLLPPYRPPPAPSSSSVACFHPMINSSSTLPTTSRQQAQAQQLPFPHSSYYPAQYPDYLHRHRPFQQHVPDHQQSSTHQSVLSPFYNHSHYHHHHHHPHPNPHSIYPNANNTAASASSNYYNNNSSSILHRPSTPPYTMSNWLDMISRLNAATDTVNLQKAIDVGSVDDHYEFDPSTPTPSASTPTGGPRDDLNPFAENSNQQHFHLPNHNYHHPHHLHHTLPAAATPGSENAIDGGIFHTATSGMPMTMPHHLTSVGTGGGTGSSGSHHLRKSRVTRYDNIDVRLQAMKEEFYAYRKRQAMKRAGVVELESMC